MTQQKHSSEPEQRLRYTVEEAQLSMEAILDFLDKNPEQVVYISKEDGQDCVMISEAHYKTLYEACSNPDPNWPKPFSSADTRTCEPDDASALE